jgi:DNA adenine methylase
MIKRYDRAGTVFFIDPPYIGSEDYYGAGMFGQADFQRLADLLATIAGRFILTVNDCPLARKVFGRFKVRTKSLDYSLAGRGRSKKVQELIVQNN